MSVDNPGQRNADENPKPESRDTTSRTQPEQDAAHQAQTETDSRFPAPAGMEPLETPAAGTAYRIDGNFPVPPGGPALENLEGERYFVGTKFTRETAEPVFVRLGPDDDNPATGPARYVGGWSEQTPSIPAELFERYQRLDNADWTVGEDLVRELFGATRAGTTPHLAGMSAEEAQQRSGPDWGTEWAAETGQAGFLPGIARVPDGVSQQDGGLLEAKHYRLFEKNGEANEVPLGNDDGRIWWQLIHDHLAKQDGDETTWVFSGAPPSEALAKQLYNLDLDYVVMAPRHRELQSGEGPTAAWRNHVQWTKDNANRLEEQRAKHKP